MQKKAVKKKQRDKKDMGHRVNKRQMIDISLTISVTNVNVLNIQIKRQKLPHLNKQTKSTLMLSLRDTFKIKDASKIKVKKNEGNNCIIHIVMIKELK